MDPNPATDRIWRLAAVAFAGLTAGIYMLFAVTAAQHTHNGVGLGGSPLFYDFSVFYQAGAFADQGRAADAYDDAKMAMAADAAFPGNTLRLPWNYPPTFQLLLMPFAAMPYVAAWLAWSFLLYGLYALVARTFVADSSRLWLLLLAPGAAVNLFFGQNGLLTTILLGGGVLLLRRRPVMAGILLGAMAYKPQFALLAPLVLIAGREWRALAAAILSQILLIGVTVALLGAAPWIAFLHKLAEPAAIFSSSSSDWRAIPSMMTLGKTLGLDAGPSAILHWIIAAAAAAGAIWAWRRTRNAALRAGTLAAATLLITPYLRGYDLVLLVLPIAALLPRAKGRALEMAVIFAAWIIPAVLMFSAPAIQFGPLVSLSVLATLVWRNAEIRSSGAAEI